MGSRKMSDLSNPALGDDPWNPWGSGGATGGGLGEEAVVIGDKLDSEERMHENSRRICGGAPTSEARLPFYDRRGA